MPHIHELYDFTTSAFILHPTEPKLCLHFHKKLQCWLQPGGHIELDEDPAEALERELKEETGLTPHDYTFVGDPDQPHPRSAKTIRLPMHLSVHSVDGAHHHIDFTYLVRAKTTTLAPAEHESQQIEWFDIDQINKLYAQHLVFDNVYDICSYIFLHYMI
jgi:8-oxo-dGTP diphosphatase